MKIDELVAALQPLVNWHIYAFGPKLNETTPCYAVRRLERLERRDRQNVILATTEKAETGFPPGITLLAKDIVRVDWVNGRAWIEAKDQRLGYFQRVRPIKVSK